MLQWATKRDITVAYIILLVVIKESEIRFDGSLHFSESFPRVWVSLVLGEKWS